MLTQMAAPGHGDTNRCIHWIAAQPLGDLQESRQGFPNIRDADDL